MDNKQVCDAIYGCSNKLVSLNNRLARFYNDHSVVCSVRNILNTHYHNHSNSINEKSGVILINDEMTRETYSFSSADIRAALTISVYKPICMRSLVDAGGSTIPKMNIKLSEFKTWLTDTMVKQYDGLQLDKLANDLLLLYREGYTFDTEVDDDFFCVTFQSNRNKSTVTLAIEVL